ncbi:Uncharacterised protein [uncultured archaeon]|nr:Uncharacterised protein [uncultured archaeon]
MENMHKKVLQRDLLMRISQAKAMLEKGGYNADEIARRFFNGKVDASGIRFSFTGGKDGYSEKMEITLAEGRMGSKLVLENGELYLVTRAFGFENYRYVEKPNPVFELPISEPVMGAKESKGGRQAVKVPDCISKEIGGPLSEGKERSAPEKPQTRIEKFKERVGKAFVTV